MPSISISNSNVLPENLWISAEFLLLLTDPFSYFIDIYVCPFSCCNSVLIMKKHPRIADSIRDSHMLSATILEYSFTLFILPQVAVSFDAY